MLPRPEVKCSINVVTLMPFSRLLVGLSFKMSNMLLIKVSLFDSRGPAPKSVPVAIPVPGKKKQQKGEGRQQQRTETKQKNCPSQFLHVANPNTFLFLPPARTLPSSLFLFTISFIRSCRSCSSFCALVKFAPLTARLAFLSMPLCFLRRSSSLYSSVMKFIVCWPSNKAWASSDTPKTMPVEHQPHQYKPNTISHGKNPPTQPNPQLSGHLALTCFGRFFFNFIHFLLTFSFKFFCFFQIFSVIGQQRQIDTGWIFAPRAIVRGTTSTFFQHCFRQTRMATAS